MDAGLIVGAVIFTVIISGLGGGTAWYVWIKSRKKKETWNAKIYQLGDGIKINLKDKNGKEITSVKLQDLKPLGKDVLEKIEKEPGITVYRLQKRNRVTQEVSSSYVEYWSPEDKEVDVLFHEGSFTLMKKGYDTLTGQQIFSPMPLSRINMMKSEMAIRKDRLIKEKDILQAITPWIVAGMALLTLVSIFYLGVQGMVQISANLKEAFENAGRITGTAPVETPEASHTIQSLGVASNPPLIEGS